MKSRERVIKTLHHEEPDRIPLDFGTTNSTGISERAYRKLINYYGMDGSKISIANTMQQLAAVDEVFLDKIGADIRSICATPLYEPQIYEDSDSRQYTDEWGINWKMTNNGYYFDMVKNPLVNAETVNEIENFDWPIVKDKRRIKGVRERINYARNLDKAILLRGIIPGTFEFATWLRGFENAYMDFYLNPKLLEALLDKALEIKMQYWDMIIDEADGDVDVINESDDLGSQNGPLISLEMYRKFLKPRHKRLIASIREKTNAKIFLHSCGAISQFIPDLIEVGFDILNPVQFSAEGMDVVELKKEFGQQITFWGGGVDTQKTLPFGTPQQVRDEVKRNIEILAPGGGFIFSQVHNIQADVPPENIAAMFETFYDNCNY